MPGAYAEGRQEGKKKPVIVMCGGGFGLEVGCTKLALLPVHSLGIYSQAQACDFGFVIVVWSELP